MPTYRSITISLISQFDVLTIPEYAPPTTPNDPFSNSPTLINRDHSLISVYIPTYPSSQFWVSYSISPPHPPEAIYYFKLYLNGNCVVSWGCSKEDEYKGKTMFGLFNTGKIFSSQRAVEKRVLCFASNDGNAQHNTVESLGDVMEIRVFRSKGRKRVRPTIEDSRKVPAAVKLVNKAPQKLNGGGISLIKAGPLSNGHPQRYYKYALLDPLDQPFATFRYYYRSWDQLERIGVITPTPSISSSIHSVNLVEQTPSSSHSNTTMSSSQLTPSENITSVNKDPTPVESTKTLSIEIQPAISFASLTNTPTVLFPSFPPLGSSGPSFPPLAASANFPRAPSPKRITTRTSFASLIRRSPSPTKPVADEPRAPSPIPVPRSGSMGVLLGVVNSAVRRRGRGVSVGEGSTSAGEEAGQNESETAMGKKKKKESDAGEVRERSERTKTGRELYLWEKL